MFNSLILSWDQCSNGPGVLFSFGLNCFDPGHMLGAAICGQLWQSSTIPHIANRQRLIQAESHPCGEAEDTKPGSSFLKLESAWESCFAVLCLTKTLRWFVWFLALDESSVMAKMSYSLYQSHLWYGRNHHQVLRAETAHELSWGKAKITFTAMTRSAATILSLKWVFKI